MNVRSLPFVPVARGARPIAFLMDETARRVAGEDNESERADHPFDPLPDIAVSTARSRSFNFKTFDRRIDSSMPHGNKNRGANDTRLSC